MYLTHPVYRTPAPEAGAVRVHNDVSPVLAQTFTDHFTVYSAKRFPGVPGTSARILHINFVLQHLSTIDTTALSIAFGNQGQKLPLVSPKPSDPSPEPS
jgi:hypothetical protein